MTLSGKVALVTGGSSGLGFSIAKKLIQKNCTVHILGRRQDALDQAAKEINSPQLHTVNADVSSFDELTKAIGSLNIDILINNAGVYIEGPVQDNDPTKISQTIDTNVKGVIFTTKVVLPKMLAKNDGFILNISSTSGAKIKENQAVYVASKFAVNAFTRSLELDLAKTGIKVMAFFPGGMKTELFSKASSVINPAKFMNPDDVADVVVFSLERNDTMVVSSLELNKRVL